jgi:hypothetical protein
MLPCFKIFRVESIAKAILEKGSNIFFSFLSNRVATPQQSCPTMTHNKVPEMQESYSLMRGGKWIEDLTHMEDMIPYDLYISDPF